MSTNTLSMTERIALNKKHERRIIEALNEQEVVVNGKKLSEFVPGTEDDDKYKKIDAWCFE
jgi:hypothetical protein